MLLSSVRPAAHAISTTLQRRAASQIAIKYAQAAYGAALKQSPQTLLKVQSDLSGLASALSSTPQFSEFVHNPTLSAQDRKKGLEDLWKVRKDADKLTKNLLEVMSENGRLGELEQVVSEFKVLVSKYRGEMEITVTSDKPLAADIMKRLETALKGSVAGKEAKSLKITNKVIPGILGGLIVEFGDKTIDLSVANRVNKLNALLQESV